MLQEEGTHRKVRIRQEPTPCNQIMLLILKIFDGTWQEFFPSNLEAKFAWNLYPGALLLKSDKDRGRTP